MGKVGNLSIVKKPIELVCHAGAGAAAGGIAATFVCPLDVIKTRLQVHGLPVEARCGNGGSIVVTSLKRIEPGLSPKILALLPNWADMEVANLHWGCHFDFNKSLMAREN